MIGLCDCNSFYASCERLFRPDLYHSPIAVLSNNDGVVVALNMEAKKLGFARGDIYAQVKEAMERQGVSVFSSNYALYQNLSDRVMSILSSLCPAIDQYSIDEAFFTPSGLMSAAEQKEGHESHGDTGICIGCQDEDARESGREDRQEQS